MTTETDSTTTWLGPLDGVRGRVRAEMERRLIVDRENGFVELPPNAEAVANMTEGVLELHESIRPLFLKWWEQGVIDDTTSIHGFTVASLHQALRLRTILATFTWLDGLVRDPEDAKRKIEEASRGLKVWRVRVDPLN